MGFKKNLEELMNEPAEMSFSKVQNILYNFGFSLKRIRGSHFIFKKPHQIGTVTVPCHNNKVTKGYLKLIKYIILSLNNHD